MEADGWSQRGGSTCSRKSLSFVTAGAHVRARREPSGSVRRLRWCRPEPILAGTQQTAGTGALRALLRRCTFCGHRYDGVSVVVTVVAVARLRVLTHVETI